MSKITGAKRSGLNARMETLVEDVSHENAEKHMHVVIHLQRQGRPMLFVLYMNLTNTITGRPNRTSPISRSSLCCSMNLPRLSGYCGRLRPNEFACIAPGSPSPQSGSKILETRSIKRGTTQSDPATDDLITEADTNLLIVYKGDARGLLRRQMNKMMPGTVGSIFVDTCSFHEKLEWWAAETFWKRVMRCWD
jgi:hypothetical protein